MFEHREGHPLPPDAGTAARLSRGHNSPALSLTDANVFDDARHRNATARSTAAGPPMFEHRDGHAAPAGAGTASRLPRGHDRLALSLTVRRDRPFLTRTGRYRHRNGPTRSTAAGPPMFEHREGHPAPPSAGEASRLQRGYGSLGPGCTANALTARIVKNDSVYSVSARRRLSVSSDLNVKHHTPQLGVWDAHRAVGSALRRGLSPADRNHGSQRARPAPHGTR